MSFDVWKKGKEENVSVLVLNSFSISNSMKIDDFKLVVMTYSMREWDSFQMNTSRRHLWRENVDVEWMAPTGVHCQFSYESYKSLEKSKRNFKIMTRDGFFLVVWMRMYTVFCIVNLGWVNWSINRSVDRNVGQTILDMTLARSLTWHDITPELIFGTPPCTPSSMATCSLHTRLKITGDIAH